MGAAKRSIAKYPFCYKGYKYAEDVVSGKITACIYVKAACAKSLKEFNDDSKPYVFDWDAAEKYLRTVQKFDHVIGHWTTKNIVYEPWQCWVWMNIMGFKIRATGFRRYRTAHVEIARGNAKSAMASQAALYFVALDNPNGNLVSTVATKKEQARIVLDSARLMANKNKSFKRFTGTKVLAHHISHPPSGSMVRALASEHSGLDGLNDVLAICDELHAMRRQTFEVITSGMSKRPDSLTLCITTAGHDVHSVGCSQSAYAKKVALGEVEDDTFFAAVYTLDEGDDWEDESVWLKPNPNLGVSVDLDTLRAKVKKALETPADIPGLKIKHMNIWISEAKAYYDPAIWDKCADPDWDETRLLKKKCRMGIDLASHIDITAIVMVFRDEFGVYDFIFRCYIPQDTLDAEKNTLYHEAVADGDLIVTPGAAINYDFIREEAEKLALEFRIEECLYDAWNATETAQKLSNKIEMVKISMNVANLSEPMKKLDAIMRSGLVRHKGAKLIRWSLANVVAKEDHNGNVFPRKSHVKLKIDPIVAALMGLAGWLQDKVTESVYEKRGIRVLGAGPTKEEEDARKKLDKDRPPIRTLPAFGDDDDD
jgi:phage terminase large subunit-like protein